MTKYEQGDKLLLDDGKDVIFHSKRGSRLFVYVKDSYFLYIKYKRVVSKLPISDQAKKDHIKNFRRAEYYELP